MKEGAGCRREVVWYCIVVQWVDVRVQYLEIVLCRMPGQPEGSGFVAQGNALSAVIFYASSPGNSGMALPGTTASTGRDIYSDENKVLSRFVAMVRKPVLYSRVDTS